MDKKTVNLIISVALVVLMALCLAGIMTVGLTSFLVVNYALWPLPTAQQELISVPETQLATVMVKETVVVDRIITATPAAAVLEIEVTPTPHPTITPFIIPFTPTPTPVKVQAPQPTAGSDYAYMNDNRISRARSDCPGGN